MAVVVVDTNVPVVANGRSAQATSGCVLACLARLRDVTAGKDKLVLDDHWLILSEYQANLRSSGQPGPGDAFLKWVLTNLANIARCEVVHTTALAADVRQFAEFPSDPDLATFDPSDRKFVAVALAHPQRPPILNAVDRDWWFHREPLERYGVVIEFLCPTEMARLGATRT